MEEVRVFIAVELPDTVKKSLGNLEDRLRSGKYRAKWVAPESIHLTLKFLGNISADSTGDVTRVMQQAAIGIPPFQLSVTGLGVFPNAQRVQVVWAGVTGDLERLIQVQKRLDLGLESLGFVLESRPFTAHLTIARMRDEASATERQAIGRLVAGEAFEGGSFMVQSISLMRSQLRREGPIYTRLASVTLAA
jgi:2'-5' RNA ligase